jgi:hypothetical protein
MKVNYLVLLFALLTNYINASSKPFSNMNYNHGIRNLVLKIVILKKKEYPKLIDTIKMKTQDLYEKTIATISECMCEYENLSAEDKSIVEFIISTIL